MTLVSSGARFQPVLEKTIRLTGGLNEQLTSIELRPGELTECINYLELEGGNIGYKTVKGYERFDGTTAPSSVDLDAVDPIVDTAREAARTAIGAVPGAGSVKGVHVYNEEVYAWRGTNLYVSDATVGWGNGTVAGTAITGTAINSGGKVRAVNGRFADYNSNQEIMVWVDSYSHPQIWNGTTVTELEMHVITNGAPTPVPILPSDGIYPTHCGVWRNRLYLVYPDGHVIFSVAGDPTSYNTYTDFAAEIYIGDDITEVKEAPGGVLLFFTKTAIKALYYGSTGDTFISKMDDFSKGTGAITDTVQEIMGTLYFADYNSFSSLQTVADFGDFNSSTEGRRASRTYDTNVTSMNDSVIDRSENRFYLFYPGGDGSQALVYTYYNKRIKSISKVQFLHQVAGVSDGTISNVPVIFFYSSSDNYVRQMNKGTSFDGRAITATFTTSFYGYGSLRRWKSYKRVAFEVSASSNTVLFSKMLFDYINVDFTPEMSSKFQNVLDGVALWGTELWDGFIWTQRLLEEPVFYFNGYSTNMAVYMYSSSMYDQPHTVHSCTVDYSIHSSRR